MQGKKHEKTSQPGNSDSLNWSDRDRQWGCVCWLKLVAQKQGLGQLSICASPVLSQEPVHSPHLSQQSHRRPRATPGALPAHNLLQKALNPPLGPVTCTQTWNSPVCCKAPGIPLFFQNYTGPRLSWEREKATSLKVHTFFPFLSYLSPVTFLHVQTVKWCIHGTWMCSEISIFHCSLLRPPYAIKYHIPRTGSFKIIIYRIIQPKLPRFSCSSLGRTVSV